MGYAYLLRCVDDSLYGGSTTDLERRLEEHASGGGCVYTSSRLPVELVWSQQFETIDEAWAMERKLHGWNKAKREALIAGKFDLLPGLSKNRRNREAG